MNLVITNRCSRRCEYCFQREWFLESSERGLQEMSPDMFGKVVECMQSKEYALLGGEPLLHSNIDEILAYCLDNGIVLGIMSNISVPHNIVVNVVKNYGKIICCWLINTDYTDEQRDLFMENLQTIVSESGEETLLTPATTLIPREGGVDASINRLDYIFQHIPSKRIADIRLSTTTPTHNGVFKTYDYTQQVEKLIKTLRELHGNLHFHFDCPPTGCEINRTLTDRYCEVLKRCTRFCNTPVVDVMPDGKVYWCASSTFLYLENVFDYHSEREVKYALKNKWKAYWQQQNFSNECRSCAYLKPDICYGLCAGKHYAVNNNFSDEKQ